MADVSISVLGSTSVRDGSGARVDITSDAQRRLLTILAAADGRRIATDVLIDRFWTGSPPKRAKGSLQTHISSLRRVLPASVIETEGHGYSLDMSLVDIDALRLRHLADEIAAFRREGDWRRVSEAASRLWTLPAGVPYADLADDEFIEPVRAALEAQRSAADEAGIRALIELGDHESALPLAESAVRAHPLRERGWVSLARARAGLGRYRDALDALQAARAALAEAGLDPGPEIRAVEQEVIDASCTSVRPRRTNLRTPISTFVGRGRELDDAGRLLDTHRLVTFTGVGGTGKSRLALEVADRLLTDTALDECWFVGYAGERDPDAVAARAVAALGLPTDGPVAHDRDLVVRALRERAALLVIDNCEHLLEPIAALVRHLVESCPRIRVLATSRRPLGVPGELVYDVPPLSLPATDTPGTEATDAESVALFVDRARLIRPASEPTDADLRAISDICRSLDGLPLAIELAAARLWEFSLAELTEQLTDRLTLLVGNQGARPDRHVTMRAAIAWSLDLLDDLHRTMLCELSVFSGAVDLDTIERVCTDGDGSVHDRLTRLVRHSLVVESARDGHVTYRLLETVRAVADEQLSDRRRSMIREQHRSHFLARCSELRLFWVMPPERRMQPAINRWWDDVHLTLDDVRAALDGTAVGAGRVDAAGLLAHVAAAEGRHRDAVQLLDGAIDAVPDLELEAMARSLLATELIAVDELERSRVEIERAVELVSGRPASFGQVLVLARAALLSLAHATFRPLDGLPHALAALEAARELHPDAERRVEALVATMYARVGEFEHAEQHLELLSTAVAGTRDFSLRALEITTALNVTCLGHRTDRATIAVWADRAIDLIGERPTAASSDLGSWATFALGRLGRHDDADEVLSRMSPIEGYELAGTSAMRARALWLRGEPRGAVELAERTLADGADVYWRPNLCCTAAEAHAELGDLDAVRAHVRRLTDVGETGSAVVLVSVLRPLVQAEVDRAFESDGEARRRHGAAAHDALARMRSIGALASPAEMAIVLPEPVTNYLALVEAEVGRLGGGVGQVDAWRRLTDELESDWFRQYARRRLVEAEEVLRGPPTPPTA